MFAYHLNPLYLLAVSAILSLGSLLDRLYRFPGESLAGLWGAKVGFLPDEGESLLVDVMCKRVLTDRDADLEVMLFTNSSPGETITEATLSEPTGTGYSRIDLTDANWTGSLDSRSYPQQTFTAGAGGWTGAVQGYAVVTKAGGGVQRIIGIEVDSGGPYTFAENDTYKITPTITGQ
jgi:hypothetical protein